MIQLFKKGSYRITLAAALLIVLLSAVTLTDASSEMNLQSSAENVQLQGNNSDMLMYATVWANSLIERDGEQRYNMMSDSMREKFKQEQIERSGKEWNFNIGVSSPWVVNFEIDIEGTKATINYLTKTSEPAYYNTLETLIFSKESGKLEVIDYQTAS